MKAKTGFISNSSTTTFIITDYTKLDDYGKKFFTNLIKFLPATEDGWEIEVEGNKITAFSNGCDNSLIGDLIEIQNFDRSNVFVDCEGNNNRQEEFDKVAQLLESDNA